MRIRFDFGSLTLDAELLDTPTAKAIAAALPMTCAALTWGEEVCFETPVEVGREKSARAEQQTASRQMCHEDRPLRRGGNSTVIRNLLAREARTNVGRRTVGRSGRGHARAWSRVRPVVAADAGGVLRSAGSHWLRPRARAAIRYRAGGDGG